MVRIYPVIASRGRQNELDKQLRLLTPQLADDELITVVIDGDNAGYALGQPKRVKFVELRESVGVDSARRIGNSLVPEDGIVLEIDDHDYAEQTLLAEVRAAFEDESTNVVYCDITLTDPENIVNRPKHKTPGPSMERGHQGYGMRAYRKWLYEAVGGYPDEFYPANDMALMCKIEQLCGHSGIVLIQKPLVKVKVDGQGISVKNKDAQEKAASRVLDIACNAGFDLPWELRQKDSASSKPRTIEPVSAIAAPTVANAKAPRKPHVLLVTEIVGHGRGGGEMSMLGYLRGAAKRGYRVSALYAKDAGDKPLAEDWLELHKLDTASLRDKRVSANAEVNSAICAINPDIIVTEVRTSANIATLCEALNIPLITMVQFWHNIIKTDSGGWDALHKRPIAKEAQDTWGVARLSKSAALLANSDFTASVIEDVFGRKAAAVVYPPIDAASVKVDKREARYVVCPSVQAGKGSMIFLSLAERHPEIDFLLLAGDNKHSRESDVIDRAGSLANVTVNNEWVSDMRTVYAETACLFIGTQTCESFSRASAEARANGIPLLVSDAGNLVNMAADGAGVVVPRNAPIEAWDAGLVKALALTPEATSAFCVDHSGRFAKALDNNRNLSDVVFIKPDAPGVSEGVAQFGQTCGTSEIEWLPNAADVVQYSLTILPGHYSANFSEQVNNKLAYWWCSHTAQMDTSRHEMDNLLMALGDVVQHGNRFMCLTSKPDADAWAKALGTDRIKWLPNVMTIPKAPKKAKYKECGVFIPGPFGVRKNIYTAMLACSMAKAEAHVTSINIAKCPNLETMAKRLGVRLHVHDCPTVADVRAVASRCHAGIMVSTAETYCFAAAEIVASGTPCVYWDGIPILRGGPKELCVINPTDIDDIVPSLSAAIVGGSLAKQQLAQMRTLTDKWNAAARATLEDILDA